jgi:uridine kinase
VDPRRPLTFAALADRVLASPPRLGGTRLVCVDGPAGSGKTTFAGRLAAAVGGDAVVVHIEDLYAGWTVTGAAARLAAAVLRPLADGRPGAFAPYDWAAQRFSPALVEVPPARVLVVEGCGSSPRTVDPWAVLRIWVEAPAGLRVARGLARDGEDMATEWRKWQATEVAEFAREDTRARADLRVDGAATADDGTFLALP